MIVKFDLPQPIGAESMAAAALKSAPLYQGLDGLIRKYYARSDDGTVVSGIYLWESRQAAEATYDDAWLIRVTETYGTAPDLTWLDTPVVVDNRHNELVAG